MALCTSTTSSAASPNLRMNPLSAGSSDRVGPNAFAIRLVTYLLIFLRRFAARQAQLQMPFRIRPFGGQQAVHHAIADSSVAARVMVAQDAIFLGAQGFDRALRPKIEIIRAPADDFAAHGFEGM